MRKMMLLATTMLIMITLVGCTALEENCNCNAVIFQLNGDGVMNVTTGQIFSDPGFIATSGSENLSDNVTVDGMVDMTTPGTYLLTYSLDYSGQSQQLLRAVVVTETTEVADPDKVLYDGTCDTVEIHYIDLQSMGDSTLIDCGDFEILIDAGLKSAGTNIVVPYLENYIDDGTIEILIATHPDADHIGGFVGLSDQDGVFDAFTVERVLDFGYEKSTTTTEQYIELRNQSGALICSGDDALNSKNLCQPYYTITNDLILRVIDTGHYDGADTTNDNENSIVVELEHGDLKYLFTGDAESNAEYFMAQNIGEVDVYKAGHHGSNTASSQVFLDAINPKTIILGVYFPDDGDGENGYGIPQQDSVDRLLGTTLDVYATGTSGSIVITSDGTNYIVVGEDNSTLFEDSLWFHTHRTYTGN